MASGAYPVFAKMEPKQFLKLLGVGETALGSALLLPLVPARLAGLGLVGFSGALLAMWWRTPGMHDPGQPAADPAGCARRQGRLDASASRQPGDRRLTARERKTTDD